MAVCIRRVPGAEWIAMRLAEQIRIELLERTVHGLDWLARLRGRAPDLPAHLETGAAGEDAAYFYLRRKGYTVVAQRWSAGNVPGDLDLIAWQGPMLCFFEVKTRTARDMTPAEAAVDEHKRDILRRLARQYLRQLPRGTAPESRFDLISVYMEPEKKPEIVHFENAFGRS
jgi:putative endonuclease